MSGPVGGEGEGPKRTKRILPGAKKPGGSSACTRAVQETRALRMGSKPEAGEGPPVALGTAVAEPEVAVGAGDAVWLTVARGETRPSDPPVGVGWEVTTQA